MSVSRGRTGCQTHPGEDIARRAFGRTCLTAFAAGIAGAAPLAGAMPSAGLTVGILRMKEPFLIPAAAVAVPWRLFMFKAFFIRADGRDAYVPGMALRTSDAGNFGVFCRHCPHMMCLCNLTDAHQILCPCHRSVFDPAAGGKLISGPAQRDLYNFAFDVTREGLRVSGIESSIEERLP